jgi:hypothetical protein
MGHRTWETSPASDERGKGDEEKTQESLWVIGSLILQLSTSQSVLQSVGENEGCLLRIKTDCLFELLQSIDIKTLYKQYINTVYAVEISIN